MWYLVVPPIVVVLSLSFLVWYLSRKGDDPAIAEKVLKGGAKTESVSFPRTKEFFLRILEKAGQRFKVGSLRAHNALHEFTQSVKASRLKVRSAVTQESSVVSEKDLPNVCEGTKEEPSPISWAPRKEKASLEHFMTKNRDANPEALLMTPIVRERRAEIGIETPVSVEETEASPRPMVSPVATHPEPKKKLFRPDVIREENLIARIARDPKAFTAYEELGDYYMEAGNIKDAKECYRQVLRLSPVHRMVKIKIRRLEKLLGRAGG